VQAPTTAYYRKPFRPNLVGFANNNLAAIPIPQGVVFSCKIPGLHGYPLQTKNNTHAITIARYSINPGER
jgi:hypothetical protein